MNEFRKGDDVIVEYEDEDHLAHIDRIESGGWCFVTMAIDPELDYGPGTSLLAPYQTVCVPLSRVRPRD